MAKHYLKQKSDLHLARKVWHCAGVLFIIIIFHNVDRSTAIQIMTLVTSLFVIVDLLRHQIPQLNQSVLQILHPIMRETERSNLAGTTYLLCGVFLSILVFPKPIVVLAMLFLAVADPLASYVGVLYGKDKIINNKSLQGSFSAFLACTSISALFYFTHNLMTDRILIVSVLSGVIGALAELLPVGKLDDNFTFPIVSAIGLWGLFFLFGGF